MYRNMQNRIKIDKIPWAILILTWILASLFFYLLTNRVSYVNIFTYTDYSAVFAKITQIAILPYLASLSWAFAGIFFFTLCCASAGAQILGWGKLTANQLVTWLTGFVIGEITLSGLLITMAASELLFPLAVIALLFIGLVVGMPAIKHLLWSRASQTNSSAQEKFSRSVSLLLAGIFISGLLLTSARLSYDSVTEYFSNAKYIAAARQANLLFPLRGFAVSALHSSILFSALSQLFGDQAARMLSWVNGGVLLLAGWAIGSKVGLSARARWFFITLLLTSTAFVDLLGDGKVELISTAPLVVALWWMIDSLQQPSRGRFLLIGALLGFAIIARPYNIFLVPVFTIAFYLLQLWPVFRAQGLKAVWETARPALWMFPTLLLMGAFHLWQNDWWLGSPLAPLTYARELDSGDWQWQFDPAILNTLRLLYPLTITFMNTPQSLGNISPLFVGFLPFLLLPGIRKRLVLSESLRSLLLPALLTLVLWITLFFTVVEIRYVFFLWILFFLFGAQVIEAAFDALESGYRTILRAALAILLAFTLVRALVISLATYSPIDSNGRAHCYDIPFCAFFDPLNESAPLGARVFVLNAYRYYLRADLFACSSQAGEYAPLQALAKEKSGQFWAELYRQGFQYITYEKNFAEVHSHFGALPPLESAPAWMRIETISSIGDQAVYQLSAINPPVSPLKTCLQTNDGLWRVTERR